MEFGVLPNSRISSELFSTALEVRLIGQLETVADERLVSSCE